MNDEVRDSIVNSLTDMFLVKEAAIKLKRKVKVPIESPKLRFGDQLGPDQLLKVDQIAKPKINEDWVNAPSLTNEKRSISRKTLDLVQDLFDLSLNNPVNYTKNYEKRNGRVKPLGEKNLLGNDIVRHRNMNLLERFVPLYKSIIQPTIGDIVDKGLKRYNKDIVGAGKNYGAIRKGLYVLGNGVKDSAGAVIDHYKNLRKENPKTWIPRAIGGAIWNGVPKLVDLVPFTTYPIVGAAALSHQLSKDSTTEEDALNAGDAYRNKIKAVGKRTKRFAENVWNDPINAAKHPIDTLMEFYNIDDNVKSLRDASDLVEQGKIYNETNDPASMFGADGETVMDAMPNKKARKIYGADERPVDGKYNPYMYWLKHGGFFDFDNLSADQFKRNFPEFMRGFLIGKSPAERYPNRYR